MTKRPALPSLPDGVVIRRATADDVDAVTRLRIRMFASMGVAQETTPEAEALSRAYLERAIPGGEFMAWLAFTDGAPIGSAAACIIYGPPFSDALDGRAARLLNVFVDEAWRGRKIARALVVEVLDECARQGIGRVGLIASEQGRPVYEALGFEPATEMRRSLDGWLAE